MSNTADNLELFTEQELLTLKANGILNLKVDEAICWFINNRAKKFGCEPNEDAEFLASFTDKQIPFLVKTEMIEYVVEDEDVFYKITNLIIYFREDELPFDKLLDVAKNGPKGWASTFIDALVKKEIFNEYFELEDVLTVDEFEALKTDYVHEYGNDVLSAGEPKAILNFIKEWMDANLVDEDHSLDEAFPNPDER